MIVIMNPSQECRNLNVKLKELEEKYDEQISNLHKIIEVFSRELVEYGRQQRQERYSKET